MVIAHELSPILEPADSRNVVRLCCEQWSQVRRVWPIRTTHCGFVSWQPCLGIWAGRFTHRQVFWGPVRMVSRRIFLNVSRRLVGGSRRLIVLYTCLLKLQCSIRFFVSIGFRCPQGRMSGFRTTLVMLHHVCTPIDRGMITVRSKRLPCLRCCVEIGGRMIRFEVALGSGCHLSVVGLVVGFHSVSGRKDLCSLSRTSSNWRLCRSWALLSKGLHGCINCLFLLVLGFEAALWMGDEWRLQISVQNFAARRSDGSSFHVGILRTLHDDPLFSNDWIGWQRSFHTPKMAKCDASTTKWTESIGSFGSRGELLLSIRTTWWLSWKQHPVYLLGQNNYRCLMLYAQSGLIYCERKKLKFGCTCKLLPSSL